MDISKEKIRYILQFFFDKGDNASQAAEMMNSVYGPNTVTAHNAQFWFRRFRSGNFDVKDAPRGGRPISDMSTRIMEMIRLNPCISSRDIGRELNVDHKTVLNHLHNAGFKKELSVWVPNDFKKRNETLVKREVTKHANGEIRDNCPTCKNGKKVVTKAITPSSKEEVANPIACDVCGEEFYSNAMAIQHKFKKHPSAHDKYICPYCGMQFPIKALLDNHIRVHSSDTRQKSSLTCEECGAIFYFQNAKDYHIKYTHVRVKTIFQPVVTPPPSKKIKKNNAGEIQSVYYCHICGSEYMIKFNLQKHLEKGHTEEERRRVPDDLIRCTTCDALFHNQKAYHTHIINHRPDDLYVANEEQRLQAVTRVDQDFDRRRVISHVKKYVPISELGRKMMSNVIEEEEESSPSTPEMDSESERDEFQNPLPMMHLEDIKEEIEETEYKIIPFASSEFSKMQEAE